MIFMCENDPVKKKYLAQAFPHTFLFDDMVRLGTGRCYDYNHCMEMDVPKVARRDGFEMELANLFVFESGEPLEIFHLQGLCIIY